MKRYMVIVLLLLAMAFGKNSIQIHPNYVPDEKTAERVAEAVLTGQFGQERVNAQLPLHAVSMSKDQWLVQGTLKDGEGRTQVGGVFGVWVNKHTAAVSVIERMK
jgi:hypothetical protein